MGVGAGLYMCDVVKKSSRSLSHLLMSSCLYLLTVAVAQFSCEDNEIRSVLQVLWMTSRLSTIGQAKAMPVGRIVKVSHQMAASGATSDVYECLVVIYTYRNRGLMPPPCHFVFGAMSSCTALCYLLTVRKYSGICGVIAGNLCRRSNHCLCCWLTRKFTISRISYVSDHYQNLIHSLDHSLL